MLYNKVLLLFVEHHRPKCRVNDLVQIYGKNPKSEPNIQSLTKSKIPHNYLSYTGFL